MFATEKLYVQGESENQNPHVLQNEPAIIEKNLVWWFNWLGNIKSNPLFFFPLFCFVLSFFWKCVLFKEGLRLNTPLKIHCHSEYTLKNNVRHFTMKKQTWLNQTLHDRYMYLQIVLVVLSGELLHFPDHTPVSSIWTQAHQCTALASSIWQNPGKTFKFIVIHIIALQQLSINTKKISHYNQE